MIRQARRDDLGRLEQLWLYSVITAHPSLPRDYWRRQLAEFRRDCIRAGCSLVYSEAGHRSADGFAVVGRTGDLVFICVTPACAGRGVGSALMEAIKRNHAYLEARLLQENLLGRYFLQQHGFVESERRTDATTGRIEILMRYDGG